MGVAIEIKDLTKIYGKVVALKKVNLSIEAGEFLVLLGPSGCGKTTLLRCIAGLETPDEGRIIIGDQTVLDAARGIAVPSGKRQVGMVFQSYALWPHMTVYENVGFGLWIQKLPAGKARQHVDGVLKDLGMQGLGGRYPSELSGGQQQRVAVARLLATQPPVFLMDEPLSNLDARLRLDMRSELKRLHYRLGVTTVYVTHDQTEAMTMASRVVVMNAGQIQQIDSPHRIYHKPASLFVAEFVGMPRINTLPAQVVQRDGKSWLTTDDMSLQLARRLDQKEVTAAVRPEDIGLFLEPHPEATEFKIYAVLPSGPEQYVQVKRGDRTLMIRETRQLDLKMDQTVWIRIAPSAINLYDRDSGMAIPMETNNSSFGKEDSISEQPPTKGG
ncbi:MAG: ABC transporter ATP-binding protein [Deltaproteobacteria bacterium]|nr:ABC transporter ATP-binding protein [Deltaproteobacteria bacterium]MBW2482279.1 ABC transporter ATP-binding protein [Deltaproteobacteria bacterium]